MKVLELEHGSLLTWEGGWGVWEHPPRKQFGEIMVITAYSAALNPLVELVTEHNSWEIKEREAECVMRMDFPRGGSLPSGGHCFITANSSVITWWAARSYFVKINWRMSLHT